MSKVRSPKSIGAVVGLTLGNAPYGYGYGNSDRTTRAAIIVGWVDARKPNQE
ncbi:hypothetical protein [Microcystis sp. LEGE 08355]|uniref:hypothetical protein n=1 Tax=Microcystis sp. LEGE 08355 TaxID=1828687 RepID=UPI00187EA067|nr:hypothetical protein [Microcystis sp. LEGE 08355]MBE9073750.1 hypothetical protein [Microcystis sp. LEGE 08355]